ncbi:Ig-like domain-containing protein [Clostridium polynesiense]|uniref:Ig-like domain-containing protein n=1 Tax=Clostridium polynesiense TaxID=1325933 RepID=UPI000590EF02|nr:Ig-like domain-containing protein [Clostridium polynesiense]
MLSKIKTQGREQKGKYIVISLIFLLAWGGIILFQYVMFSKGFWKPIQDNIIFSGGNALSIIVGEEAKINFKRKIVPSYAKKTDLHWQSDNSEVLQIDNDGIVRGLNVGEAKLKVNSSKVQATAEVKVNPVINFVKLESIVNLRVGEEYKLKTTVEIQPKDSKVPKLIYETESSQGIIEVSEDGVVKALSPGDADVVISCGDKKSIVNVSVMPEVRVKSFSIPESEKIMLVGDEFKLNYNMEIEPEGAEPPPISYKIINHMKFVTIKPDGTIKAISPGRNLIEITCGDKIIFLKVNVKEKY